MLLDGINAGDPGYGANTIAPGETLWGSFKGGVERCGAARQASTKFSSIVSAVEKLLAASAAGLPAAG
jgi:hypothetical protein